MVLQAGPGLLSCCPGFGASGTAGIDPIDEAAAAADDFDDGLLGTLCQALELLPQPL